MCSDLSIYLANVQMFRSFVQGVHWNLVDERFFTYHAVYKTLYEELFSFEDVIAEAIRTCDELVAFHPEDIVENSTIDIDDIGADFIEKTIEHMEEIRKNIATCSKYFEGDGYNPAIIDMLGSQDGFFTKYIWQFKSTKRNEKNVKKDDKEV